MAEALLRKHMEDRNHSLILDALTQGQHCWVAIAAAKVRIGAGRAGLYKAAEALVLVAMATSTP